MASESSFLCKLCLSASLSLLTRFIASLISFIEHLLGASHFVLTMILSVFVERLQFAKGFL